MGNLWAKARQYKYDALSDAVKEIVYQGYPMGTILSQLYDDLISMKDISDLNKGLICEKIAEAESNLVDGSNELLQLLDVAGFIMRRLTDMGASVDSRTQSNH
jgi:replication factor C subunit 2/4